MFQLEVTSCHRDDVQNISEALVATHALSVTLTDKYDDAILEPALGTTPLWPHVVVTAVFEQELEAELARLALSSRFPELIFTLNTLPSQDWQQVSIVDIKPQRFGKRLWICPSWLTPPEPDAVHLILDPGLAFGTGTHPTTALCLTWLEQASLTHQTMIDYGSGSGILALAALKLGARHVDAVDIDEQAILATKNNADANQIPETHLTVGFPDQLTKPVDILIANILLLPLKALKHPFHQLINPNGTLVVSGLLESQMEELIEAYRMAFTPTSSLVKEGWGLLVFSRTEDAMP
ncbi:MAG: 50S ribosomal protein L11 methyltransferase [Legionellales bacterium]|nr:50S ribosomal protein L11 methyltransferase [Legionellales bacterium]